MSVISQTSFAFLQVAINCSCRVGFCYSFIFKEKILPTKNHLLKRTTLHLEVDKLTSKQVREYIYDMSNINYRLLKS